MNSQYTGDRSVVKTGPSGLTVVQVLWKGSHPSLLKMFMCVSALTYLHASQLANFSGRERELM